MNYTPSLGAQATYIRGGTGVIWGNIVTGASTNSCFTFINFRAVEYIYSLWLGCDGRAAWDLNDMADHTGNEYGGGPSGLYAAGTAGTRSAGRTLVVTGANYPANHWRGYAIINLDQQQPGYSTSMATISGNTSDTISVTAAGAPK